MSWCKLEVTVNDPKDFNPFLETDPNAPKEVPPLTIASLTVRTIVNHAENIREIVCVSARIWSNCEYQIFKCSQRDAQPFVVQIEDATPPEEMPCTVHTFVRPLERFPPNFENTMKTNSRGTVSPVISERVLLNSLLGRYQCCHALILMI